MTKSEQHFSPKKSVAGATSFAQGFESAKRPVGWRQICPVYSNVYKIRQFFWEFRQEKWKNMFLFWKVSQFSDSYAGYTLLPYIMSVESTGAYQDQENHFCQVWFTKYIVKSCCMCFGLKWRWRRIRLVYPRLRRIKFQKHAAGLEEVEMLYIYNPFTLWDFSQRWRDLAKEIPPGRIQHSKKL